MKNSLCSIYIRVFTLKIENSQTHKGSDMHTTILIQNTLTDGVIDKKRYFRTPKFLNSNDFLTITFNTKCYVLRDKNISEDSKELLISFLVNVKTEMIYLYLCTTSLRKQ